MVSGITRPTQVASVRGGGDFGSTCVSYEVGWELWRSDGTPGGTTKLEAHYNSFDIEEGDISTDDQMVAVGNTLYFTYAANSEFVTLAKITNADSLSTNITTFDFRVYVAEAVALNDKFIFILDSSHNPYDNYGTELWISDGTEVGTKPVLERPDYYPYDLILRYPKHLRVENGILYFTAISGYGGARIAWRSDGTQEGTVPDSTCPTITLPSYLPTPEIGKAYSFSVAATPVGTYTYSIDPSSIDKDIAPFSLDAQTGMITGVTSKPLHLRFHIRATNAAGCVGYGYYYLYVACPQPPVSTLPKGQVGQYYAADINIGDFYSITSIRPYTNSSLPSGITFSSNHITGTPTQAGTYNLVYDLYEATSNCSKSGYVDLIIDPAPPQPGTSIVRINAGGPAYTSKSGNVFEADTYFEGNTKTTPFQMYSINNTLDDNLYRTDRVGNVDKGNFRYQIPVSNGQYQVRLHFSENYFKEAGKRVFSVAAEGEAKLVNYDIYAAVGRTTAVIKTYPVTVVDGALTLDFSATVNRAKINAIEVLPSNAARQQVGESTELKDIALQAFPNPFSAQTTLRFTASATGKASIEVYNLNGALVQVAFEGTLEEGETTEVALEGANLPAGIYIIKATSASKVSHLKLIRANY